MILEHGDSGPAASEGAASLRQRGAGRPPVTATHAAFVAAQSYEELPADVREAARQGLIDCVASAVAGRTAPVADIVMDLVAKEAGQSVVWGTPLRTSARNAALVNGTLAHAHDFDDTNSSIRGHPSAPVVPAVLALAAELDLGGKDVIAAYVAGFEVEAKIGRAVNIEHYERGWHTSITLGSLGAAAACAYLLKLNEDQIRAALAIAVSTASGLRANWGTMIKPLHVGMAAENGIFAARLAAAGMNGNRNILEANEGFFDMFCGTENADPVAAVTALGKPYDIVDPGILYKIYPSCSLTHCAIDLAIEAVESGAVAPQDIVEINCGVGFRCEKTLPFHAPKDALEGKFSLEYCIATALAQGRVDLATFVDECLAEPAIRDLMSKIRVYTHPDLTSRESIDRDFTELEIVMRSGARHTRRLSFPKGHPKNPLSPDEVRRKFDACTVPVLGGDASRLLWEKLSEPEQTSAREITQACAAAG